jgi:hypothetical protein
MCVQREIKWVYGVEKIFLWLKFEVLKTFFETKLEKKKILILNLFLLFFNFDKFTCKSRKI